MPPFVAGLKARTSSWIWLTLALSTQAAHGQAAAWTDQYRAPATRLIAAAVSDAFAWHRLAYLTDTFGHRLSGSAALNDAILWAAEEMKRDGLENVHTERVMVPRWIRGRESAEIVEPGRHAIAMLGLGDSVGTPASGIRAELLIVDGFTDLDAKSAQAKGRIVLFNVPYTSYDETRAFRSNGPSRAARYGAVAALVRSVGPPGLRLPHTGALFYDPAAPKIPAAAIATEDADRLQRMADRGTRIVVRLSMEARFEADAESFNLIGELRGRERPDEFVVIGGHIDSWDVGTGASDDAGGCVATWDAVRLMKKLDLRPRRTVRVVLWTNEENGGRGGIAYRDAHRAELERHVMMLESDTGVFRPLGFGFSGSGRARETVMAIAPLLQPIGADQIGSNGGGSDIEPSVREAGIPAMSTEVSGDYFRIHHTEADTVDKIDPINLSRNVAAIAVMSYIIADLPQRLGH